jgi:maltose-binding protein MalE
VAVIIQSSTENRHVEREKTIIKMKKGGFFMNLKKLVSVMLVSAMALSMGACGNSGNSAANTSSNGNSGSNESASSTESGAASTNSDDKLVVWTLSNDLIDYGKRFEEQTGVAVDCYRTCKLPDKSTDRITWW